MSTFYNHQLMYKVFNWINIYINNNIRVVQLGREDEFDGIFQRRNAAWRIIDQVSRVLSIGCFVFIEKDVNDIPEKSMPEQMLNYSYANETYNKLLDMRPFIPLTV